MSEIIDSLKVVFEDNRYFVASVVLAIILGLFFSISMGLLYLTPIFFINTFEFFEDGLLNISLNFAFVFIAPILASLTIVLSIYKFTNIRKSIKKEGGTTFLGLISAIFVSTCQNCVPLVLYSLGVTYGTFIALFAPLVLPFKFITLGVLAISFYLAAKSVGTYCKIK